LDDFDPKPSCPTRKLCNSALDKRRPEVPCRLSPIPQGGGGSIVNFLEHENRAMNISLPDYFWLYKRDCGAVLDEKGRK
jgi:hypothetical protein